MLIFYFSTWQRPSNSRCSFLTLIFIVKSVSKNLLIHYYHFKIHVHSNVSTYQDRVVARVRIIRINKARNFCIVVPPEGWPWHITIINLLIKRLFKQTVFVFATRWLKLTFQVPLGKDSRTERKTGIEMTGFLLMAS